MNDLSVVRRDRLFEFEAQLKQLPQIEIPVRHYFSPGLYAREVTLPATAIITGVIHKYPQINILSKGTLIVADGETSRQISAPFTLVSEAGIKRAAYAITECVWTTIVHTFKTDVEEIEREFFAYSEKDYQDFLKEQAERQEWLA